MLPCLFITEGGDFFVSFQSAGKDILLEDIFFLQKGVCFFFDFVGNILPLLIILP